MDKLPKGSGETEKTRSPCFTMEFGLSTRWSAGRHTNGQAMIEEILGLGLRRVELGYDLRMDLVPGVQEMVKNGSIIVDSVHNFCPVPVGAPRGHPELFTMTSSSPRTRESAVHYIKKTIHFAAEMGAKVVIVHAGNVEMNHISRQLCALYEKKEQFSPAYEKVKMKLQVIRDKKARKHLDYLRKNLDLLFPVLEETGITLALENLPTWESIPTELEMEALCREFKDRKLKYWHDIGHGQVRENLGFINLDRWLERLQPYMAGMHIHDVIPPAMDHLMPPEGKVDFSRLKKFASMDILRILEPIPDTPAEKITGALEFLRKNWDKNGE